MKHLFKKKTLDHPELERALSRLHSRQYPGKYKWKVRASSLPMCLRFYAFHLIFHHIGGIKPPFTDRFILDITGDAGTNVHTVYQRWMSRAGVLFGDYKCKRCGIFHYDRIGPVHCMGCGREAEYEEIRVDDSLVGYSGHIDGLCPIDPSDLRKGFLLVDIKTGKEADIEPESVQGSIHKGTGFALSFYERVWKKWMWQISTYVANMEHRTIRIEENGKQVEIPVLIYGCAIIVVNRGRPWRNRLVFTNDYEPTRYDQIVHDVLDTEDAVREFVYTRDAEPVLDLPFACKNPHEGKECPWSQLCFNDRLGKELEDVLDAKYNEEQVRNELRRARKGDPHDPRTVADPILRILRKAARQ